MQVHEWYLSVYADAFEWVEAPNTVGMSQKTGEGACPFNLLYWHSPNRHRDRFAYSPRMANMFLTWDRMDETRRDTVLADTNHLLEQLKIGETV